MHFKNEKGIAMVLAITLIGLLTSFGMYLILGSRSGARVTSSVVRNEAALNLADAAVSLGLRCLRASPPSVGYKELAEDKSEPLSEVPAYIASPNQSLGDGKVTPGIYYVGLAPPQDKGLAGWMIGAKTGDFHGIYYNSQGEGRIPLPASKGDALSRVNALTLCVLPQE